MQTHIRELRIKRGLTQSELAKTVGVTQTAVSQWEIGLVLPSLETLMRLTKALDCKVEELVSCEDGEH